MLIPGSRPDRWTPPGRKHSGTATSLVECLPRAPVSLSGVQRPSRGIAALVAVPCSPLPLRITAESSPDSQLTPVQSQGSRLPSSAQSPGLAVAPRLPLKLLAKPSRSPLVSPAPPRVQAGDVSPSVRTCCIQSLDVRTPRAKDRYKAQATESSKDMQCRSARDDSSAATSPTQWGQSREGLLIPPHYWAN